MNLEIIREMSDAVVLLAYQHHKKEAEIEQQFDECFEGFNLRVGHA